MWDQTVSGLFFTLSTFRRFTSLKVRLFAYTVYNYSKTSMAPTPLEP